MARIRTRKAVGDREGIILLVVISMLVLFSLVGLAFVVYAEGQANTSRIWREGESLQQPDMDPELLLAYFLGQLIYDTNNPNSALRGWGLATNMYGQPNSTTPFNGTGRLHTGGAPATDDYYNIDYTNYPTSGGRTPGQFGSPNPPYTFPDFNHPYLAAVQASTGNLLAASYVRVRPDGQVVSLRPSTNYHTSFSKQASPSGDVLNRADTNGYNGGPFDSIWIDIGFPVMTAPDGRKFKPLFAPLIEDMDGKVNVNSHGNVLGDIAGSMVPISHQGWHPHEVNLGRIITAPNEFANLLMGNSTSPTIGSRYDPTVWLTFNGGGRGNEELKNIYAPGGHFYCTTNLDCWNNLNSSAMTLPTAGSNFAFPNFSAEYSHGWYTCLDNSYNGSLFNFWDPRQNCYWISAPPAQVLKNNSFRPYNAETWLRYGDECSPSLTSEIFMLCPQSFATAKTRRLMGWQSFDIVSPGLLPSVYNAGGLSPYQLAAAQANQPAPVPSRPAINFPAPGPSPGSGEFGPTWNGVSLAPTINTLLNRIDLNRRYTNYYPTISSTTHMFGNAAGYAPAQQERQQLAQDIFTILRAVTGADNPATSTPGTPQYDALRWLAQLAVNIVDFVNFSQPGSSGVSWTSITPDDIMTCFNWNPAQANNINNGWVFGTVLPRLVVNEAYVQIANTPGTTKNNKTQATSYDVNFWVELHNTFTTDTGSSQVGGHPAMPATDGSVARLFNPTGNYAGYRLLIAQTTSDSNPNQTNTTQMLQNSNVQGIPVNIETVVDQYTPDPNVTNTQPTVLTGDSLNQVLPNFTSGTITASAPGSNQGFYVLGPGSQGGHQKTPAPAGGAPPAPGATPPPIAFPGTQSNPQCFATLPVKQQTSATAGDLASTPNALAANGGAAKTNSSMSYVYKPSNPGLTNFNQLNHTIVLQRLACPYMAYQPQPTQANFNPYVTVDFMMNVPISSDTVTIDGVGPHQANPQAPGSSVGRNQPYAADNTQQVKQTPANPPPAGQPQHTFFAPNSQGSKAAAGNGANAVNPPPTPFPAFRYDWLVHANRPLVSNMELLQVSGFKPHLLTQMFMTQGTDPNTGQPTPQGKFQHRAPWFQSGSMIYRALEFFEGGIRPQWTPPGGRTYGKVNINTIYDIDTWQAVTDQQPIHFFTSTGVTNIFNAMISSRGMPGAASARPFLSLAAPYAAAGNQFPNGASIDDTILRSDPNAAATTNPLKRLLEPNPNTALASPELRPAAQDHPYLRLELLNRILNNTTTRSNVFAVWVTVGFFEVVGPGVSGGPPQLGQEINFSTNRHVRHRMFAIVDRTNLTISQNNLGSPGPKPWFINSMNAVTQQQVGQAVTITLPTLSGQYDGSAWSIAQGSKLVIDTGASQEVVTVAATNSAQLTFTATFTKPHPIGFAVGNAILGNPGPQPRFDLRQPSSQGVVRYFSIIE